MSDIRQELSELQALQGIDFVRQLRKIASRKEFRPFTTDPEIYFVGVDNERDTDNLCDTRRHHWSVVCQELHDEIQTKIKSYRLNDGSL